MKGGNRWCVSAFLHYRSKTGARSR